MNFFTRLSNGWEISKNSFKVLKANKDLIIFPILSGCSMLIVMASFAIAIFAAASSGKIHSIHLNGTAGKYLVLFLFYLVNYFIIVFFNMALIHCTRAYFRDEEVNLRDGINFSLSRFGVIFSWAVFAATVGTIL